MFHWRQAAWGWAGYLEIDTEEGSGPYHRALYWWVHGHQWGLGFKPKTGSSSPTVRQQFWCRTKLALLVLALLVLALLVLAHYWYWHYWYYWHYWHYWSCCRTKLAHLVPSTCSNWFSGFNPSQTTLARGVLFLAILLRFSSPSQLGLHSAQWERGWRLQIQSLGSAAVWLVQMHLQLWMILQNF